MFLKLSHFVSYLCIKDGMTTWSQKLLLCASRGWGAVGGGEGLTNAYTFQHIDSIGQYTCWEKTLSSVYGLGFLSFTHMHTFKPTWYIDYVSFDAVLVVEWCGRNYIWVDLWLNDLFFCGKNNFFFFNWVFGWSFHYRNHHKNSEMMLKPPKSCSITLMKQLKLWYG